MGKRSETNIFIWYNTLHGSANISLSVFRVIMIVSAQDKYLRQSNRCCLRYYSDI